MALIPTKEPLLTRFVKERETQHKIVYGAYMGGATSSIYLNRAVLRGHFGFIPEKIEMAILPIDSPDSKD